MTDVDDKTFAEFEDEMNDAARQVHDVVYPIINQLEFPSTVQLSGIYLDFLDITKVGKGNTYLLDKVRIKTDLGL